MSLGRARCGGCCDPVTIGHDAVVRATARARSDGPGNEDDLFIAQHWRTESVEDDGETAHVRCDQFSSEHRTCRAHSSRPPVCRDYPWYGREPGQDNTEFAYVPQCSYLLDLPPGKRPAGSRPLIPLEVL